MAQLKSTNITGNLSVTGNVLASKIIKFGGTTHEVLLADGSVAKVSTTAQTVAPNAVTATAARTYIVQKNGDQLVVNVPWVKGESSGGTLTEVNLVGGGGITLSSNTIDSDSDSITISHKDTSSQTSMTTGGRTYINSITLDEYGHVTALGTGTETVTNTDTKVTQSNTTTTNWRKVILSNQSDAAMGTATTEKTDVVYVTPNVEVQPSTGSLRTTGNLLLHNPNTAGGDSPKLVFQRGDEKGTVTDWNMYVQSGALKINSIPTSGSTTETKIAEFAYHGGMTVYSASDTAGVETASMTVKTSNGGQLIIGKEGPNGGTMLRFDQKTGIPRLRFRASDTPGAMVWEQPETAARLYLDFGNAAGNGTNRVNVPNPEGGGTLALLSDLNGFITSVPNITITDTDKTNKIVGGITASGQTITVSRIGLKDLGLASAYKYQGSVAKYENLPASNNVKGDVWNITATGMNYAWTGTEWDALGSTVDLSSYVTGSGTANYIPKFTAAGAIGNSVITQSDKNDITVAGKLVVKSNGSTSTNSYNEGIRILPASNGWSELFFSNTQATSSTHANGWILGKRGAAGATSGAAGDFTIECNGSGGTGLTLYANGNRPRWNNNELAYKSDFGTGGSMDLSNYVDKTTAQTISGIKTFTAQPVISTTNGLKFDSGNCKLRIYNTSASPTDYSAIEVRSNSTSTNRNLFIDLANNSLVVGAASGTPDTTYKVNVKGTFNATTIYENGTTLSSKYLGINAKAADSDKLDGQDSSYYMKASDISNHISGTNQPNLAYFATSSKVAHIANTSADNVGNIKAVSYGIYTDVANDKTATWQYNSSTDCVELMWN